MDHACASFPDREVVGSLPDGPGSLDHWGLLGPAILEAGTSLGGDEGHLAQGKGAESEHSQRPAFGPGRALACGIAGTEGENRTLAACVGALAWRALCSSLSSEPAAPPASGPAQGWLHSDAVWPRGEPRRECCFPARSGKPDGPPPSALRQPLGEKKDDKTTGGLANRLGENRGYRLTVPEHRRVIMQQTSLSPSSFPIPKLGMGQR